MPSAADARPSAGAANPFQPTPLSAAAPAGPCKRPPTAAPGGVACQQQQQQQQQQPPALPSSSSSSASHGEKLKPSPSPSPLFPLPPPPPPPPPARRLLSASPSPASPLLSLAPLPSPPPRPPPPPGRAKSSSSPVPSSTATASRESFQPGPAALAEPPSSHSPSQPPPQPGSSTSSSSSRRRRRRRPPESARGRPGGRADDAVFPTAPHALLPPSSPPPPPPAAASSSSPSFAAPRPPVVDASPNARLPRLSQQPSYPGQSPADDRSSHHPSAAPEPLSVPSQAHRAGRHPQQARRFPTPFRSRIAATSAASSAPSAAPRRPRRLSSARLWNPTNSTPRTGQPPRKRRPSTPPAPPVPLQHPSLDRSADARDHDALAAGAAGDYPLLTLSEQRQSKHSPVTRASFQVEGSGGHDQRVSLPRSVRASYDGSRSPAANDVDAAEAPSSADKGKGRVVMGSERQPAEYGRDLERGPEAAVVDDGAPSSGGGDEGIGSALSSSNSSIMGEEVQPDGGGEEWGPRHPCYPHLNPHVAADSAEYATTRIIRIRRDWLLQGDLAPTFSNLYPEILDPAGVSEHEFRRVIEKLNAELVPVFNPYGLRNVVDGLLGLLTGWLWDDLGLTGAKARLRALERWIDGWNAEMEKATASDEGAIAPRIIPLRQTAYMTLDIQIPDPEIAPAPSSAGAGESRTALPLDLAPAVAAAM